MNTKNLTQRLACYLHAAGVSPVLVSGSYRRAYQALLSQYNALPLSTRRHARRRGRQIIRQIGLKAAAANLLPEMCPNHLRKVKRRHDRALKLSALFRLSRGHCSSCKTWGHAKRSWPSRELAEEFRPLSGDLSLNVYECPAHPGTYHLGHIKANLVTERRSS